VCFPWNRTSSGTSLLFRLYQLSHTQKLAMSRSYSTESGLTFRRNHCFILLEMLETMVKRSLWFTVNHSSLAAYNANSLKASSDSTNHTFVTKLNNVVSWSSGFRTFVITHSNKFVSNFRDSFRRIGVMVGSTPSALCVLLQLHDQSQLSQPLYFTTQGLLFSCCKEWDSPSIM